MRDNGGMYGRNIFATNNNNSNLISNNYSGTSYNSPSYNSPSYSNNQKLGSYRTEYARDQPPSDFLTTIIIPWKQYPPVCIASRQEVLHLSVTELRVEDYYLMRMGKLQSKQQDKLRDALRNKTFNEDLMRGNCYNLLPFSKERKYDLETIKRLGKRNDTGNINNSSNNYPNNTTSYNTRSNGSNAFVGNGQNNNTSSNIFSRNSISGPNNYNNTSNNNNSYNNNYNNNSSSNNIFSAGNNSSNFLNRNSNNTSNNNYNNHNNNSGSGNNIFSNNSSNNNSLFSNTNGGYNNSNNNNSSSNIFNRNNNSSNVFSNGNNNNNNSYGNSNNNNILSNNNGRNIYNNGNNNGGNNLFGNNSSNTNQLFSNGNNNSNNNSLFNSGYNNNNSLFNNGGNNQFNNNNNNGNTLFNNGGGNSLFNNSNNNRNNLFNSNNFNNPNNFSQGPIAVDPSFFSELQNYMKNVNEVVTKLKGSTHQQPPSIGSTTPITTTPNSLLADSNQITYQDFYEQQRLMKKKKRRDDDFVEPINSYEQFSQKSKYSKEDYRQEQRMDISKKTMTGSRLTNTFTNYKKNTNSIKLQNNPQLSQHTQYNNKSYHFTNNQQKSMILHNNPKKLIEEYHQPCIGHFKLKIEWQDKVANIILQKSIKYTMQLLTIKINDQQWKKQIIRQLKQEYSFIRINAKLDLYVEQRNNEKNIKQFDINGTITQKIFNIQGYKISLDKILNGYAYQFQLSNSHGTVLWKKPIQLTKLDLFQSLFNIQFNQIIIEQTSSLNCQCIVKFNKLPNGYRQMIDNDGNIDNALIKLKNKVNKISNGNFQLIDIIISKDQESWSMNVKQFP